MVRQNNCLNMEITKSKRNLLYNNWYLPTKIIGYIRFLRKHCSKYILLTSFVARSLFVRFKTFIVVSVWKDSILKKNNLTVIYEIVCPLTTKQINQTCFNLTYEVCLKNVRCWAIIAVIISESLIKIVRKTNSKKYHSLYSSSKPRIQ